MRCPRPAALLLVCCLATPSLIAADAPAPAPAPAPAKADAPADKGDKADKKDGPVQKTQVYVGIYLTQIYSIDIKGNAFTVDFYLWFRWKGDDVKPMDTFELSNGRIDKKDIVDSKKIGDYNYACCRCVGIMTEFFDVNRFPLDSHDLEIEVEDGTNSEEALVYVADTENSGHDSRVQVPGYKVVGSRARVDDHAYKTNYGDTSLPTGNTSTYSRMVFAIDIARPDSRVLFKLFWGVFLSVLIAFLAFLVKPNDLDPRFGLGVGAIFAASANGYIISSYLPDTAVMTLADKLNFTAISFIFASLLQSAISLKVFYAGKEELSKKLDVWSLVLMLIAYIAANLVIIF